MSNPENIEDDVSLPKVKDMHDANKARWISIADLKPEIQECVLRDYERLSAAFNNG